LLNINDEENDSGNIVYPLLPGHYMVFNVDKNGNVKNIKTKQFHSFEDQPLHLKYQEVELMQGKNTSTKSIKNFCNND